VIERDLHTGPRGLRLRLRIHGADIDGVPVVVLHGYLEQSAAWDRVARALQPRRVLAPDHRGHGLSEHLGAGGFYHFWDYVGDADAVVDHALQDLPDQQQVDLVGHSMGGTVACLLAACVPDKIRRLVLIEGLGPPDGEPRALQQARTALRHRRSPPTHRGIADLDEAVTRMRRGNRDLPASVAPQLAARLTEPDPDRNDGSLRWTWDALHRARSPQAFSAQRFMTFLGAINAPTLMVEGADSPYRHIPDLDARRQALPQARTVVLPECGHHPHHTHPHDLAELIREHLDART